MASAGLAVAGTLLAVLFAGVDVDLFNPIQVIADFAFELT
jgi:hypothetical protein